MKTVTTTERPVVEDLPLAPKVEKFPEYPPVAKLLWDSMNYLKGRKHWVQGTYNNGKGGYCAVGVLRYHTISYSLKEKALILIREELPEGWREIQPYNDDPATRKKHILDVFQRAFQKALALGR